MMNVSDVMTREVLTAKPSTPLREVARLLVEHAISGLPVVDNGRIVGVISEADFVDKQAHSAEEPHRHLLRPWLDDEGAMRRSTATLAGEAMTAPVVQVAPSASLSEAARLMGDHRVNRLPVVDGDELVGIITRADIVRSYVRSDADIAADLQAALRAVDGISVNVEGGIATIVGTVRARALAETIVRVVASVPGVVAVDERALSWYDSEQPLAGLSKSERDLLLTRA